MTGFNVSAWCVRHKPLVLFFMLATLIGGAVAFRALGRSEDPDFTVKVAIVTAVWPGATAREVQDQVADRVEKKLQALPAFEKVVTYAKPSLAVMQVTFRDSTPAARVPELFYQLRKKLDDVRPDLPQGATLAVDDEYGDVDSLLYTLSGDGADPLALKGVAEGLRQDLLRVEGVAKVDLYGVQDPRIFVEFSHAKLATLGITPQTLFDSLARQNALDPAGSIETGTTRVPLRVTGALDGVEAVGEIPVESDGRSFRLRDIATVTRGFADPPQSLIRQRGRPALAVGVVMAKGADLIAFGKAVDGAAQASMARVPRGIELERIADQPKVVAAAMAEFEHSFVEALAIVLAISFLSLGWRSGAVVALSVPLVLAITFVAMHLMGIALHRITLGALIIALGLLVDDAIIAVEMMVVKIEEGWSRTEAAAFAWKTTAFPMLTGTLVTVAGFVPVGFAKSTVGEYAGGIFWVVAIALIASWCVAVAFTPLLGVWLLPREAHADAVRGHDPYGTRTYGVLRRIVALCVDHPLPAIGVTAAVVILAAATFTRVQQQFFPISERPELFLQLRLPQGSTPGRTVAAVKAAEALVAQGGADVVTFTAYVGQGSPRFWLGLNPELPNEAFAEIVIVANDVAARERVKARLETAVMLGAIPDARVRVDRFNFGPPVGFPVQVRVTGPDPLKLREIAGETRRVMAANPDLVEPQLDWSETMPAARLVVDQGRARTLGLDVHQISQALQMLLSGVPVTVVREGIEQVPVVARAIGRERLDPGQLEDLSVATRGGTIVPVSQVARVEMTREDPILWRRNRDLTITVRSDVVDGVQPPDAATRSWEALASLRARLPAGYRLEMGGAIEESVKANMSLAVLFPVMLLVTLAVLMVQLQSFSRLLLVLLTAPLGIVGAAFGLMVSGKPFGFVALLGLIALAGMIMRNSVILIDQIESDVRSGRHERRAAIVNAVVQRARPVVLTAAAAVLAMIPLSRSAFWGPMAVTIMGGLVAATFLTLLFFPALYAFWFRRSLAPRNENRSSDRIGEGAILVPAE